MHLFRLAVIGEVARNHQDVSFIPHMRERLADPVIALRAEVKVGCSCNSHGWSCLTRLPERSPKWPLAVGSGSCFSNYQIILTPLSESSPGSARPVAGIHQ